MAITQGLGVRLGAGVPLWPDNGAHLGTTRNKMCSDNPDLPKEANKAKCFTISCFVLCASRPNKQTLGTSSCPMQAHLRNGVSTTEPKPCL